jgi:hypothetical protein
MRQLIERNWQTLLVIFGTTHQSIKLTWIEPLDLTFEDPVVLPVVWV